MMEAIEIPVLLCGACKGQMTITRGRDGGSVADRRDPANWTVACTFEDCAEKDVAYRFPRRTMTLERADGQPVLIAGKSDKRDLTTDTAGLGE